MFKQFVVTKDLENAVPPSFIRKVISSVVLYAYLLSFVISPVYASTAEVLPPPAPRFHAHHEHMSPSEPLLKPQFYLPRNLSLDKKDQVDFRISIKDIGDDNQKHFFVSLQQKDRLISRFYLGTDFNHNKDTSFVVPIIGTDALLRGWSWNLSAYGLVSLQIRPDGAVIIDQAVTPRYQRSCSIAAPAVHLGAYRAKHLHLQSPEVVVHNAVDIENFEIESGQAAGSLLIGEKGSLRLKELLFHGNFVNLGSLFLDKVSGFNKSFLRLQGSEIYNWGTISNDSELRLADLKLFENFGQISAITFAVGALQFLNHQTITSTSTHIIAQNQFVNDVDACITGTADLQVISLAGLSNQGVLKGSRTYVAGQNLTGKGRIVAENLKSFANIWDGQGHFKASTLEFAFQQLLSKGDKARFEGGRLSLVSHGDNSLLALDILQGDTLHLELAGTDLRVDTLDFSQDSVFKVRSLAISRITPGLGEVDWQAEQRLELPPELVKFKNRATLKAKALLLQAIQSPKDLIVKVHTLGGKSIQASSLDLTFIAIGLNLAQQSIVDTIKHMQLNTLILDDELGTLNTSVSACLDTIMGLSPRERMALFDEVEVNLGEARTQVLEDQEARESCLSVVSTRWQELYDHFAAERNLLEELPGFPIEKFLRACVEPIRLEHARKKQELKNLTEESTLIKRQIAKNAQKLQRLEQLQQLIATKKEESSEQSRAEDVDDLYKYVAQQELRVTYQAENFENTGHLQGKTVLMRGHHLHNIGTIAAEQKTTIDGVFTNAVEGIVESSALELMQPDRTLNNAGKIITKVLRGVDQVQNTGHLEVLRKGLRLQSFHNLGYADLGAGHWFFEDFTNAEEAVCKLGKRTEVVRYKNAGALYATQSVKITGNPSEGLGQFVIDDKAIWYILPDHAQPYPATMPSAFFAEIQDAVLLSSTGDEEAYLANVRGNPVAGLIGFLALSEEHPKRLFTELSLEETRNQWTRVLSHLGYSQDPISIIKLLHEVKAQLWDHQEVPIEAKYLKAYPDIPAVVVAMDKAIINILTGAWGLEYLKGISAENTTTIDTIATGVGKSFYQQQQSVRQLYKETYDAFAKHFMQNQGLGKPLLQKHYKNVITQISSGYFRDQEDDSNAAQLILHSAVDTPISLMDALQKSAIMAESLQVNYDADFTNTVELSVESPLILRTKKFWNKGKILGDLLLLCDEFTNGTDNDHLGEISATQGAINVYSQGKIDNRFGRIFSDKESAIETLEGNILVGSLKEVITPHVPRGNMTTIYNGCSNLLTSPTYLKKTFNGAFVSSNSSMKLGGYFGEMCLDYGEVFANHALTICGNLIRNISGLIRTRHSAYFYGDRYVCTRPNQMWFGTHNRGEYTGIRYLLECADAGETTALEDIWFNVPQVDIQYSNISAGKGIYKFQELIAGYGKNYVSGLNLVPRKEMECGSNPSWVGGSFSNIFGTTPASLKVGEDILIQGPDAITISGSMSAGGKVHIDVNSIVTKMVGHTRAPQSENFLIVDLYEVAQSQTGGFFALQDTGQVDSLYPITSRFSWKSLDIATIGAREESAISETAFEFALQKALAESVGHLNFEEQSSMALQEYLFRNGRDSGSTMSLDELVAKATKPLVAMVARQVQQTMLSIPHLLVPAKFVNPYQSSGDIYGKEVHLLTSGDQEHESSRIVARKAFEARAKGKMKRHTAKYVEILQEGNKTTISEKAKPQQQFICEEGDLTSVSTQDYTEVGSVSSAGGKMLRGSEEGDAFFKALELHKRAITTEKKDRGFFGSTKKTVTTAESSDFLVNKAIAGISSRVVGKNVTQVGVEEHAAQDLTYASQNLSIDAGVGINRTQTTSTTKGTSSSRTTKSLMEMPTFVRNMLNAHTIRFEGQDTVSVKGTEITADTIEDHSRKGAKFGPTVREMRYEMSTSSRTPLSSSNCGTRGGQELMAPTSLNVRRIVRSASFDDVTSPGEMEFVSCVWQDRERVEILGRYQESVYILKKWQESWAHHHQVIPSAAISVIAIAVSLATQGVGTSFFTSALGSEIGATMASAGLKYLICSAATSFAQTGDLEGTLKNLASDRALRGLAISIASAGLTNKLAKAWDIPLDTKPLELVDHLKTEGLQAGVSTTMNLALSNEEAGDILKRGGLSFVGSAAGAYGAAHIGDWYKGTHHQDTYTLHKVLHSLNGGAMGFVMDGTAKGFISGAIGAAVTETILEARNDYLAEKAIARMEEAKQDGTLVNPEKIKEINAAVKEDLASELRTAQLSSAAIAALLGQDAALASHIGGVAGTHNWEPTIGTVITLGLAAYGAYEVYDTYRTQGPEAALQQLAVMGVVTLATVGAGYVIGTVFYPSAAAAWTALMSNYPKYGQIIAKITGSKAAQTLGKAKELYGAANAKLASAAEKVGWKSGKTKVMPKAKEAEDAILQGEKKTVVQQYTINDGNAYPSLPVGSSRTQMQPLKKYHNSPKRIEDMEFSSHALDRLMERGIPPSVVKEAITHGVKVPNKVVGRISHYDAKNNVTVITENGRVVTARFGK